MALRRRRYPPTVDTVFNVQCHALNEGDIEDRQDFVHWRRDGDKTYFRCMSCTKILVVDQTEPGFGIDGPDLILTTCVVCDGCSSHHFMLFEGWVGEDIRQKLKEQATRCPMCCERGTSVLTDLAKEVFMCYGCCAQWRVR